MDTAGHSLGSFLTNDFGDRYLYSVNRNAFNRIGSDALYRSHFGEKLSTEYQFNIIIGTDSGMLVRYIIKSGIPTGSRFLFIELPEVIDVLEKSGLMEDLPPEISVTDSTLWRQQAGEYQISDFIFLDAVHLIESIASTDANIPEYRDLSWTINQELMKSIHRIQVANNSAPFILKQLENLPENRLAVSSVLHNIFPGKTAIILAGGPSLNAAFPWIRENRDRLVVIAVSRISRILLDEGIVPHFVVSVDPQKISFDVSREMLRFADLPTPPLLVNSHHVSPLLLSQWGGNSVYSGSLFPWKTPLNVNKLPFSGPTVSNYALSLAVHLGCTTIILAGVNLCFSADGQTHAAGSNENKVGPDLGQVAPRVETYGGGHADSNRGYLEALETLEMQAKWANNLGADVYNCSLDAAKIPNIEYKSLDAFELPPSDATTGDVLSACIPDATSKERLAHYKAITKELNRIRSKLQEILNLSNEALGHCDGLFGRNGKKQDFRHKIQMDKIEHRLDRSLGAYTKLVKQFGLKKFLASLKVTSKAEELTDEQLETATREYYETYVEGTEYLIKLMDATLERVRARVEEEKDSPDFGTMACQWEKDQQFGRLHIWRNRHPELAETLTAADQQRARELDANFTRSITEEETSQIKLLEELHDVSHTRSKALLLFMRAECEELETMARGLKKHPDQNKALPYLHFINGLLAELRNEPQEAVSHYENLFTDPPHTLTEDALLQFASLAMKANDVENSLLAMECLVGTSPSYLPPYGDLLKAIGRFEEAFDAYNRYLGFAPDDVAALVNLGLFCKEAGLKEPAAELFRRVLEKDTNNSAAKTMLQELNATASA